MEEVIHVAAEGAAAKEKARRGPGRPTDKRKDTVLRLRIDVETHKKLGEYAARKQVSMSELVRKAIEDIVDKEEEKNGD